MSTETARLTPRERTRTGGTQREKSWKEQRSVKEKTEGGDEMHTDLSEIWDVTLINPNLLCHKTK